MATARGGHFWSEGAILIDSHRAGTPVVYVVSDSIGETAELVARAAISQFNSGHVDLQRISYCDDQESIDNVLAQAAKVPRSVIVYTIIIPELREYLSREAGRRGLEYVDIMGPMMAAMARVTGVEPRLEPGLVHKLDEGYFRRVEAVEFAVKYDDGKDPRGLLKADVVLLGVSRTSKTPVSMYLAHRQIKVANVPLVPEVPPPEELYLLPPGKVVGLTIDPEKLHLIREERLKTIGLPGKAEYAKMDRILTELRYAEELFHELGCPVVDVTRRAVEETANKILEIIKKGGAER